MATISEMQSDQEIEAAITAKMAPEELPIKEETPEDDGEPTATEKEAGDSQSDAEEDDPTAEEFEFDGKVYKAPKELKEAVLRHKDYTEKTMQTAEERKFLVQEREFLRVQADFQTKFSDKIADHRSLESQLKQYENLDWAALANADQAQYLALDRQERTLRERFNRNSQELQGLASQFNAETENQRQKRLVAGREMLRKEFKDEPADIGEKLSKAGESYGFTRQELDTLDDPRHVRVLRDAMKWRELQSAKPTITKRAESATPVKVQASRSAQSVKTAADVEAARQRFSKSKKLQDGEDFMTRLLSRKR